MAGPRPPQSGKILYTGRVIIKAEYQQGIPHYSASIPYVGITQIRSRVETITVSSQPTHRQLPDFIKEKIKCRFPQPIINKVFLQFNRQFPNPANSSILLLQYTLSRRVRTCNAALLFRSSRYFFNCISCAHYCECLKSFLTTVMGTVYSVYSMHQIIFPAPRIRSRAG